MRKDEKEKEDINLLEDKSYFSSHEFPHKYIDATDIVRQD